MAGGPGLQPSTEYPLGGRFGVQLIAGMVEHGDGRNSMQSPPHPISWLQQARFWRHWMPVVGQQ